MTTKICSKCKVEKDVGEFYKDRTARDGLQYKCKPCAKSATREWRVENPEKFKKDIFKWRAKNQERVRELSREATLRSTERLTDCYVKLKLGVPNPPQELIELKRLQLQIHRELKQQGEVK